MTVPWLHPAAVRGNPPCDATLGRGAAVVAARGGALAAAGGAAVGHHPVPAVEDRDRGSRRL